MTEGIHLPFVGRAFSRRSLLYWCAVAGILIWAVIVRLQLPVEPIGDNDVMDSLYPVLNYMDGKGFQHRSGTATAYSLIVVGILEATHDLRSITVVQEAAGVLAGLALLLAWNRLRSFGRFALPQGIHEAAGLVLLAIYLFSENRLFYERRLRPEGLVGAVAILTVYLTFEFIYFRFIERRPARLLVVGNLALFCANLAILLRATFTLTVLVAVIPVVISLFGRGEPWWRKALLVLPAALAILPLRMADAYYVKNDRFGQMFLSGSLFTIHADLIANQMQQDLASTEPLPYDRAALAQIHRELRAEMAKSAAAVDAWSYIGFNPDYLFFYTDSICAKIMQELGGSDALKKFEYYYFVRSWRKNPGMMLGRVGRELQFFYGPGGAFKEEPPVPLAKRYKASVDGFHWSPVEINRSAMGRDFLQRTGALVSTKALIDEPEWERWVLGVLTWAYTPVFALTVLAWLAAIGWQRFRQRYGMLLCAGAMVYGYNVVICLGTAVVHSLAVRRYIHAQFPMTLFAEFFGLLLIAEMIARAIYSWRGVKEADNAVESRPAGVVAGAA